MEEVGKLIKNAARENFERIINEDPDSWNDFQRKFGNLYGTPHYQIMLSLHYQILITKEFFCLSDILHNWRTILMEYEFTPTPEKRKIVEEAYDRVKKALNIPWPSLESIIGKMGEQ